MKFDLEELVKVGSHWLELFDSNFAMNNLPLNKRPLQSAIWFVKDGIEKLPFNDSKENFLEKEWFTALVIVIREWYQERYGTAHFEVVRETFSGIVLMYRTPIKIEVPVAVTKVHVEGETCWITFPDSIHESENLKSFFPTCPNFDALPKGERIKIEKRVDLIVSRTRSINLALQAAADLPDEAEKMAAGVWWHIEKAVADILSLDTAVAAVGCWELHLAVEKSFKVFLRQNESESRGHNLIKLSTASGKFGLNVTKSVLAKLPEEHRAIKLRYGEADIEIFEAVENYEAALQLVYEITGKLKRTYSINNAAFLLKKPPWVGLGT
ncbi:hypothetical protein [Glaciimonas sp. PAMC28666]|uniref:hypothetical protein n=1 Tax=Glaciimonas sp. PAMC28666 TaxID=2807626 RepID=UPI001964BE80|nr:hypothetical protein [Glaciimonas sp. PAMC28666]QRX80909.1 hypothetical protein JQN73_11800 [Glaciimonas sp. PAMC28666]